MSQPRMHPQKRVVSLLPSATEMLCHIGGRPLLVGRSHECDEPADVASLPMLSTAATHFAGGAGASAAVDKQVRHLLNQQLPLYGLNVELLRKLRPDVILTQDLCRVCSIDVESVRRIAAAMSPVPQVISCNAETVEGVLDDMLAIGDAVGLAENAQEAVTALRERLYNLTDYTNPFGEGPNVAFLEWTDPLFIGGHWIPQLIERAGGRHVLNATVPINKAGAAAGPIGTTLRKAGKSVTVPPEVLVASRPEYLIIAPCGLKLDQALQAAQELATKPWWRELPAVKTGRVAVVDGNAMFARPGPRLADAFAFLVGWLNDRPELIPANFPWQSL